MLHTYSMAGYVHTHIWKHCILTKQSLWGQNLYKYFSVFVDCFTLCIEHGSAGSFVFRIGHMLQTPPLFLWTHSWLDVKNLGCLTEMRLLMASLLILALGLLQPADMGAEVKKQDGLLCTWAAQAGHVAWLLVWFSLLGSVKPENRKKLSTVCSSCFIDQASAGYSIPVPLLFKTCLFFSSKWIYVVYIVTHYYPMLKRLLNSFL